MGKRVLITGVSKFLGASLARRLQDDPEVDYVAGVDLRPPPFELPGVEYLRADIRTPLIQKIIATAQADTVVHCDLTSSPVRVGGRSAQKEQNVIGTMHLLGACQRSEIVRKVVVRSSTAVYGIDSSDPSILSEDRLHAAPPVHGYSKDVFDAETSARDFGRRRPEVTLTILRMANVVGPRAETNMTQFFSLPVIPTALGFDPRLQLLHEDDAVEVLRRSVVEDHPGVYNVAADGVMYLSQAIRIARRIPMPILAPLAVMIGDTVRRTGVIDFSTDQINLIVHGRVVDTTRLKDIFGYAPAYSTLEAFRDFVESTSRAEGGLTGWEKEIYAFITRTGARAPGLRRVENLKEGLR
ncbi:MAG TPA: NAD-dependent epimerase/dehydratase family protein [Actinomycetota bacterium]|nr:NAD-dependent epimerase/dehydratase family protein [Actinomycetota bacterium]